MASIGGDAIPAQEAARPGPSLRAMLRSWRAELAPFPNRWRRAARVALVTALGAGVMAALQIANPLGLTLLLSFAAPESAFSLLTAVSFLLGAAALQIVMLAIVSAVANSPVAHVGAFIAYTFVTTYLIYGVPRLERLWLWVQIPTVTSFYLVLFDYRSLGWENAQMFAGMVVAAAMLWLINTVIWPQPAAVVLKDSLRNTLERSRHRLKLLVAIFLADDDAVPSQDRPVASKLGYHLTLLKSASQNVRTVREPAESLAAVIVAERIHNEIERVCEPACRQYGVALEEGIRRDLHDAATALDMILEGYIDEGRGSITEEGRAGLAKLVSLQAATEEARDLISIVGGLVNIANVVEHAHDDLPNQSGDPRESSRRIITSHSSKFLIRFCARHTIAMTLAFVTGLFDNNAALHAALWLLMIGGPPSHGATAKKFTVRAIGAAGALVFAALATIVLALNFVTLPPYMLAIVIGIALITYVGEGGGELSYLAIGGTAFVIAFSGPGPRREIVGSIWTIWGICFGMILRALVSTFWQEHTNRTLAEEFERPLAALVILVPSQEDRDPDEIAMAEAVIISSTQEILTVATDAQLQGRTTGVDASNLVDALDTIIRLAFALGNLRAIGQNEFDSGTRAQLESWLASLRFQLEPGLLQIAPLRTMVSTEAVAASSTETSDDPMRTHVAELIRMFVGQLKSISLR
jgi:hypothetical protein